jgi:hypothetical protein
MEIKKSPSSDTNTYHVDALGVATESDNMDDFCIKDIRIQFTSDHEGETLSLYGKYVYTVPYEVVEMLVDHTRKQRSAMRNKRQ